MDPDLIKKIPLFSGLSREEVEGLLTSSEKRRYPRGSIVLHKSDEGQVIYLILKGKVKVVLFSDEGKEIILNTLESGNYFGEMSAFDRRPRSATIITMEESEFLVISREAITDQIKVNPLIALKLLAEMSRRLREADEQINNLALLDVRGRVARVLLTLSKKQNAEHLEGYRRIPRPSSKEIAAMSGTSRETVSRILSDFSKKGLIGLTKDNIIIFERLQENDNGD
jgi:CRP-like cAMP-binding protein